MSLLKSTSPLKLAADCAIFAESAYGKTEYECSFLLENENTRACIFQDEDTVVISIAGTDDKEDVLNDIDLRPRDIADIGIETGLYSAPPGIKTAAGFLTHAMTLLATLQDLQVGWENKEIILTGHSLGGAVAILLSLMLPFKVHQVIVFGAPRCIVRFSRRLSQPIICVAHVWDPVTWIPFISYRNPCSRKLYINDSSSISTNVNRLLSLPTWILWVLTFGLFKPKAIIGKHSMTHYKELLRRYR